jgi:hypothetical protein
MIHPFVVVANLSADLLCARFEHSHRRRTKPVCIRFDHTRKREPVETDGCEHSFMQVHACPHPGSS